MGVTTYYSVGGEIIGERSGGVRTDYLRDALGSVTATKRTDRGTISNTYRYKPYGERLAKTGVAADPRFQWVGTAGYRETTISHSKSYVRARHYGQEEARWTTVDSLYINLNYLYTSCSPIFMVDPSGYLGVKATAGGQNWVVGQCGYSQSGVQFTGIPGDGYVVQKITLRLRVLRCGEPPTLIKQEDTVFWELFCFKGNRLQDADCNRMPGWDASWSHDNWVNNDYGDCTEGSVRTSAEIKFVRLTNLPPWFNKLFKKENCPPWLASDISRCSKSYPGWDITMTSQFEELSWNCCRKERIHNWFRIPTPSLSPKELDDHTGDPNCLSC